MNSGNPPWIAGDEEHEQPQPAWHADAQAASDVEGRWVSWGVQDIIAGETVTIIGGEPGAGKTFLGCKLVADFARVSQCPVVFATSGQEPPEQLRWRLDQAGADPRRVALVSITPKRFTNPRAGLSDEAIDRRIDVLRRGVLAASSPTIGLLPTEIYASEDSVPQQRPVPLLVVDDVDGWFGRPGQCLPAATLARVIQHLNQLAREFHVAIVVLTRAPMSAEGRLTSAQLARLSQSASVVWLLVKDRGEVLDLGPSFLDANGGSADSGAPIPKTQHLRPKASAHSYSARRWLLPVNNNLAPDGATFGRALELSDGRFRWRPGVAPSLAEATQPSLHNSDRRRLRHAAAVWLEEALAAGPLPSKEIYRQGVENGFSQGTLKRAATELGIFPHKAGFDGGWVMRWTSCASSTKRGEIDVASCASSTECEEIDAASCASSTEREEIDAASCESSTECEEIDAASCESSTECEEIGVTSCESWTKRGEIDVASCASSTECEEIDAASCESSTERGEIGVTSCASSAERGEIGVTSCASSAEREEIDATSCASSQKCERIGASRETEGKPSEADIHNGTSRRERRRQRRRARRTQTLQGA